MHTTWHSVQFVVHIVTGIFECLHTKVAEFFPVHVTAAIGAQIAFFSPFYETMYYNLARLPLILYVIDSWWSCRFFFSGANYQLLIQGTSYILMIGMFKDQYYSMTHLVTLPIT